MSDVFVSHSSKDKEIAEKVVKYFEDKGLSCWMAPRDIVPGTDWAAAINTAITASKVFVIIYTANSAESSQVSREISLAENKPGVHVVPYKTDDTPLKGSFEYYLTGSHFIAANYAKKDYKLEELYDIVAGLTGKNIQNITNNTTYIENLNITGTDTDTGKSSKMPLIMGLVSVAVVLIAVAVIIVLSSRNNNDPGNETSVTPTHEAETPTPSVPEPTLVPTDTPTSTESPTPTDTPTPTMPEYMGSEAGLILMKYINKYGNHFENENGEYYSIKHAYGPIAMDDGTGATKIIDDSRIYMNSRYEIPGASDTLFQLGIYNKDLHLTAWINYNINSQSFELNAYEDEEKGRSRGSLKSALGSDFNGQINEEVIKEYNASGWYEKDEFFTNIEDLLFVLRAALESDFSDMDEAISWEGLGFINWGTKQEEVTPVPGSVDEAKEVLMEYVKNNGVYYPDEGLYFLDKYYEELSSYIRADLRTIYNTVVEIVAASPEDKADDIRFIIENPDISTLVVVSYNSETGDYDLFASEVLPDGGTRVIIQGALKDYVYGFYDKIIFVQPEYYSIDDFRDNTRLLVNLLHWSLEEIFNEINIGVSFETLGLDYWI